MSNYAIDVEIISDRVLSAAQFEFCVAELCKAIDAPPLGNEADEYGDYTTDGRHGYMLVGTDEHHYHAITLRATACADINAIVQIICAMCSEGCIAICNDEDDYDKRDYLNDFSYRLNQI